MGLVQGDAARIQYQIRTGQGYIPVLASVMVRVALPPVSMVMASWPLALMSTDVPGVMTVTTRVSRSLSLGG